MFPFVSSGDSIAQDTRAVNSGRSVYWSLACNQGGKEASGTMALRWELLAQGCLSVQASGARPPMCLYADGIAALPPIRQISGEF